MPSLSGAHNAFKFGASVSRRLLIGSTFKIEIGVEVGVGVKVGSGLDYMLNLGGVDTTLVICQ